MATKHLYVSGDDAKLWEEVEAVALREHRSVSFIVHEALRYFLDHIVVDEGRRATP